MADRKTTHLLKRSNVSGKIPTTSQLKLGEVGLNTADAKLYTEYTGGATGATEVRQIGWDRLSTTGGTVNGNVIINGSLTATTISASTYLNLPEVIHTGEITGSTVLSATPTLITNKPLILADASDFLLASDTDNGDALSKVSVADLIGGGVGTANSVRVTAKAGENITAGQVLYLSGATGGFPVVHIADNTDFRKSDVLAIANETKVVGQQIIITILGLVENIDTSGFGEGEIMYLGTGGTFTNIHPTGINAVQRIGHAVKINASTGSILLEIDQLTVINEHDGIVRHQLVNQSSGTSASAAYTLVNDVNHRSSISMVGSNFSAVPNISDSLIIYNEGYNKTVNAVDGNFGFEWWTDTGATHNLSSNIKMGLSAVGDLTIYSGQVNTNTARLISLPTQDNSGTDILVRNTTTGVIEYRQVSSISGATDTNYYVTGGTLFTDTIYFDRTDTLSAFTVDLSAIDVNNTFATGFTYTPTSNTFTIDGNAGFTTLNSTFDTVSGLTVNGGLITNSISATTMSATSLTINGTTFNKLLKEKVGVEAGSGFTGNPKKITVTFATAFDDANYAINITGQVSRTFTYESQTASGFVINSNANLALTGNVYWFAKEIGEV